MLRLGAEEKRGPEKRELGKRDGAGLRASDDGWRATASLDRGGPELRYRFDQQPGQQVGQSVADLCSGGGVDPRGALPLHRVANMLPTIQTLGGSCPVRRLQTFYAP